MFKVCLFLLITFSQLTLIATNHMDISFLFSFFSIVKIFLFVFWQQDAASMGVNGGVVIKFWKTMETAGIKQVWMGLSEFKSNKFSLSSKAVSRELIISKLAVTIHKNSSMTIHKLVSTHIYLIRCSLSLCTHMRERTHTMLLIDCNVEHAFLFQYKWVCIFFQLGKVKKQTRHKCVMSWTKIDFLNDLFSPISPQNVMQPTKELFFPHV